MAHVSTYLNFERDTETAFNYYKSIFGGEFRGQGIMRMGDIPTQEGMPPLPDADKKLVMFVELAITAGHKLMGTDSPESMGFKLTKGNNVHINLTLDSRADTKKFFDALSQGGVTTMELQDMFWGDYFGSCQDKFGVNWMVNCPK
jgi:PhnB protein